MTSAESAFLYVIGSAEGPHKVGLSRKPKRRLAELQCGSHVPLLLKKVSPTAVKNAAAVEAWAHEFMRAQYLRGEWFAVSADEAWKHLQAAEVAALCNRPLPEGLPRIGSGRPALRRGDPTVKTTLRLPQSLLLRAKAAAGEGDASELMREGIETEVRRRERLAQKAKPDA